MYKQFSNYFQTFYTETVFFQASYAGKFPEKLAGPALKKPLQDYWKGFLPLGCDVGLEPTTPRTTILTSYPP